jgi:ParB-like chromosome segregation protein Spo0J
MKYQLFPALDAATEAALRSSIKRWGVLVPVAQDQHGNILDGHHRSRIADELGVKYRVDIHVLSNADEAAEIARTLNTDRRHLDPAQRRQMVAELRSDGHSLRAIAGAVGTSLGSVQRDLATVSADTVPDRVVGLDGKSRPSTRLVFTGEPQANKTMPDQLAELLADLEPDRTADESLHEAKAILDTTDDPVAGVVEAVESRRTPQAVPKKTIADGIPPHPATYPHAVLDIFAEFVTDDDAVLDPFGGVGGIHKLRKMVGCTTVAIELEAEWAAAHPDTIHGDATRLSELVGDKRFDVIATSPAYGNRLADDYQASDPHARRSYAIDLGRSLTEGSGAGMQYATNGEYEALHRAVWWQAVGLLEPGGLFLLNCKDFQRSGEVMPVTGWHVGVLADMGLVVIDVRTLPAAGLPFTTAKPLSELVVVFRKPHVKAEMYAG